jgi:septal ring factor EnvC (AmiA/AmiB activator)
MKRIALFIPLLLAMACPAQAKIYMYVDADGRKGATDRRAEVPAGARITSVIEGGASGESSAPKKPAASSGVKSPSPTNFPRIDSGTQKKRDDVRRTVLEEELASEQKNLDEAKRQLAVGEKPLAGEKTDTPSYQARIKQLRSAVERHERNISAIRKEIGSMR